RRNRHALAGADGGWTWGYCLGPGAGAVAHYADGVELSLLAGAFLGPLAHLVALVEQFDLLHFLERLSERGLGLVELDLQLVGGTLEVLAPLHRGLGVGRIGEMAGIVNPGSVLLGLDLALQIAGDALELGDHTLDLRHLAPLLVDLKLLQA